MGSAPRLHILGCGRAARAVARRLLATGLVRPGLVVNQNCDSALEAVRFIGAGEAVERLDERVNGDWLMLGLPDGLLADGLERIAESGIGSPSLAFHLSGSVPAAELGPIGAAAAAVHPVRAFANPAVAADRFDGTWCVAEGDESALAALAPVFEAAGGRWLPFTASDKAAWHAATVASSNFLVTIQALARELADSAGLPSSQAAEVLCDLQQGTLDLLRDSTPAEALTGPIERGDSAACGRLVEAAGRLPAAQTRLFVELGRATLDLAQHKRGVRDTDEQLASLFSTSR